MGPADFKGWIELLGPVGACGVLFIIALHRGWIVLGREHNAEVEQRKKYEEQAWRLLELTSTLKDVAGAALRRDSEKSR